MISSHSDNIDCCLLLFIKSNCWNQNLFWLTFHSSLPKRKRCSLFSRSSNFTSAPFRVFGIEKIKCFDITIKSKLAIYCLWWNWNATPATTWSRVAVKMLTHQRYLITWSKFLLALAPSLSTFLSLSLYHAKVFHLKFQWINKWPNGSAIRSPKGTYIIVSNR